MQVNHATDDLIISQAVLVYVPLKPTGTQNGNVNSSQLREYKYFTGDI